MSKAQGDRFCGLALHKQQEWLTPKGELRQDLSDDYYTLLHLIGFISHPHRLGELVGEGIEAGKLLVDGFYDEASKYLES